MPRTAKLSVFLIVLALFQSSAFQPNDQEDTMDSKSAILNVMADILNLRLENLIDSDPIDQIQPYPETTVPMNAEIMKILEELREESALKKLM